MVRSLEIALKTFEAVSTCRSGTSGKLGPLNLLEKMEAFGLEHASSSPNHGCNLESDWGPEVHKSACKQWRKGLPFPRV